MQLFLHFLHSLLVCCARASAPKFCPQIDGYFIIAIRWIFHIRTCMYMVSAAPYKCVYTSLCVGSSRTGNTRPFPNALLYYCRALTLAYNNTARRSKR